VSVRDAARRAADHCIDGIAARKIEAAQKTVRPLRQLWWML